jgi:uncharacterized membrane protein
MVGRILAAGVLVCLLAAVGAPGWAAEPVARAVLFFLPTCGHCEYVINDVLPGLFEEAGGAPVLYYDESLATGEVAFYLITNGRLQILLVNSSVSDGAELFAAATDAFDIPSGGVPRLVVGDRYLIGSGDIPERFPDIVLGTLDEGGTIDWPAIPGLAEALDKVPVPSGELGPVTTSSIPGEDAAIGPLGVAASMGDRFRQDPVANSISVAVLALMVVALVGSGLRMRRSEDAAPPGSAVALLAVLGLGIAAYLVFVEVGGSEAVCGPVGDCNTVQQSEYARLFGVIPIGLLGVIGYTVTLVTWGVTRLGRGRLADVAAVLLFAGVVSGVLLSAYLTFLEPFAIGASCAWCLGSAVIITVLLWLTARAAVAGWSRIRASS